MTSCRLAGTFLELCNYKTVCPCWVNLPPDEDRCTGVFAWSIDEGAIGDIDVSGRQVVSLSFHAGHRDAASQSVRMYVDDDADDTQIEVLEHVFSGRLGGLLEELGTLLGELLSVEKAPIDIRAEGTSMTLTVGRRVRGDAEVLHGSDGGVVEPAHARLSTVLGPRADVGRSSSFRIDAPGMGFDIDVTGRAAMRGRFEYEHAGIA
ncbi:DUF1326 domain-containing protein [Solirubrobacter taibaiensis]|nr:DUF1326 domain-containing protein [Solirubrobacter taibaiensis]